MKKVIIEGVEIILTKMQEKQIIKQNTVIVPKGKKLTVEDLVTFDAIEKVLKQLPTHKKYVERDFKRKKDYFAYRVETIIKGLNFVANDYKEWIKDFTNSDGYFVPYFYMGDSAFSCSNYNLWLGASASVVGLGFKSKELMLHGVKYFLEDYRKHFTGK